MQCSGFLLSITNLFFVSQGPCRRHLAAILQELKAPLYMNGEDIFIPNCDTKGFYRRKQVSTLNMVLKQRKLF